MRVIVEFTPNVSPMPSLSSLSLRHSVCNDGEIRKVDVAATADEPDAPAGIRVKVGITHEGRLPHARALNGDAGMG